MELRLSGKAAIVTGASKGLGRAIARELAGEGANVAMCSRDAGEIEAVAEELRASGGTVYAQAADVTDPAAVTDLVERSVQALGGLDILVNYAGRAHPGTFETLSDADWQADLDVKLFSMIRCSRAALPHLRARGGGRIININAVLGKYPDPAFFATSVNRAACLSFTKALAIELAPDGILVNSVNIGYVETPQWERIHERRAPDVPRDEFLRRTAADVPLGRFGTPEDVSAVVAFLASERAGYLTGASIDVAGGFGRYL
jgi:NAD(P)-dependent dehydrogenase (short-subunit alcohol dehydrogenase family)